MVDYRKTGRETVAPDKRGEHLPRRVRHRLPRIYDSLGIRLTCDVELVDPGVLTEDAPTVDDRRKL